MAIKVWAFESQTFVLSVGLFSSRFMVPFSMQQRYMGVFLVLGGLFCLCLYHSFTLTRSYLSLRDSALAHQSSNALLLRANAKLQSSKQSYQNQLESLTQLLSDKSSQYAALDVRIEAIEALLNDEHREGGGLSGEREERIDWLTLDLLTKQTLLQSIPSGSPVKYQRVSSAYGSRKHPMSGKRTFHQGIDLVCRTGEPIIAPADGVVETVRPSKKGFGNFLTVRHGFGFMSSYAHLSRFKVRSGEFVRKGEVIALCGNSGNSTGPHLHYEVRFAGRLLNPKHLIDWSMADFMVPFKKEKKVNWSSLASLVSQNVQQALRVADAKVSNGDRTPDNADEDEVVMYDFRSQE